MQKGGFQQYVQKSEMQLERKDISQATEIAKVIISFKMNTNNANNISQNKVVLFALILCALFGSIAEGARVLKQSQAQPTWPKQVFTALPVDGDAYQALQGTLDTIKRLGGGVLQLERGTYTVSKYLNLSSNTIVWGAGKDETIIRLADNATSWVSATSKRQGLLSAIGASNVWIRNIALDGNKDSQQPMSGQNGIYFAGCETCMVSDVSISNFQANGLVVKNNVKTMSSNVEVKYTTFMSNGWDALSFNNAHNLSVHYVNSINNGRHGLSLLSGVSNFIASNFTSTHDGWGLPSGGCGFFAVNIFAKPSEKITLAQSTLTSSRRAGVCVSGVSQWVLDWATIEMSPVCISLSKVNVGTVSNTVCNTTNALPVVDSTNTQIDTSDNNVFNTSGEVYGASLSIKSADDTVVDADYEMPPEDVVKPTPSPILNVSKQEPVSQPASRNGAGIVGPASGLLAVLIAGLVVLV